MRNKIVKSLRVDLITVEVVVNYSLKSIIMSTSCNLYSRTGQHTAALAASRVVIHYLRSAKLPLSISALVPDRTEETQRPEEWFKCL